MKIRKVGRERPILYRGKFDIPTEVISRLSIGKNHLMLAQIANFNGKVDEYYLAIDNFLSAVIVGKEGALTTKSHKEKIDKFFKHFGRRAKIRSIEKVDFMEFYHLWLRSRYGLYFPSSPVARKMSLFTWHLCEFTITESARSFKSDETILTQKVEELLEIYQSEVILEETAKIHEHHQMEAEMLGEMYGGRLGMKLGNPWNFMEISLLADRQDIADIIDQSQEIRTTLVEILKTWDKLVSRVQMLNFEQIALGIADAKMKKRGIDKKKALSEAVEAAAKHPETHKFRIVLNFAIDTFEPKRIRDFFARMIRAEQDLIKNPNKAIKSGWENYKEHS
jgi:hypothetical protein